LPVGLRASERSLQAVPVLKRDLDIDRHRGILSEGT
jgi:hypothetical protein